jgi:hypothetical protein
MTGRSSWQPPRKGGYSAVSTKYAKRPEKTRNEPVPPKGRAGISKSDSSRQNGRE